MRPDRSSLSSIRAHARAIASSVPEGCRDCVTMNLEIERLAPRVEWGETSIDEAKVTIHGIVSIRCKNPPGSNAVKPVVNFLNAPDCG